MKVFLDDERKQPPGWILTKTPKETIELLKTGKVTEISLDHDLGDDINIGTGYTVLVWIEEQVFLKGFNPPIIHIHTANSSARIKMLSAVKKISVKKTLDRLKSS